MARKTMSSVFIVSNFAAIQKNMALEHEILDRVLALRRARAKALQEQMTPHFINNVLQTINWLAVEETGDENSQTSQAIILLADIINTGKQQKYSLTTVEEEIVYIEKNLWNWSVCVTEARLCATMRFRRKQSQC